TAFLPVRLATDDGGVIRAQPVPTNTSGDFAALRGTDGYVELAREQSQFPQGTAVPLYRWSSPSARAPRELRRFAVGAATATRARAQCALRHGNGSGSSRSARSFAAERAAARLALHRLEELGVGLRVLQLVQEELDRGELVHGMQHLAQHPHLLQLVGLGEELFLARAGAVDVDRGEYALLGDAAI